MRIGSLYLSMRRGVFAAGANTYCTTKSSGYSETSASFSVSGFAGVSSGVLDVFFGGLGIVAILECGDVGASHVDAGAVASRQTAPRTAKRRTVQKVSKCRERQQRSMASVSEVRSEYEATRQDKAVSGSLVILRCGGAVIKPYQAGPRYILPSHYPRLR